MDSSRLVSTNRALRRSSRARILSALVAVERRSAGFPDPFELASAAAILVIPCPLPSGCTELTDGSIVLFLPGGSRREEGFRVFRGLADALLERDQGAHTSAEVWLLAARLAAPPKLMREVGLGGTIAGQPFVTEHVLRAWWAIQCFEEKR